MSEDMEDMESNSLVDGVAYLSLCATGITDTAPEPFYLGSSSGATIARMIQTSIFRSSGGRAIPQGPGSMRTHLQHHLSPDTPPTISPGGRRMFAFPFLDQAQLLFDTFFDKLHTRWPLLDRQTYAKLFDRQYDDKQGELPIMEHSIMHLIYAIAARFLQLTRNPCGVDPEKHLIAAIEPMDYILEQHNLGTVQFLLLLALHGQRSPYGAGAWSQVRYAVSLCIELGLHRERRRSPGRNHDGRDLEIRRRVFWTCYSLDRGTSVLLGRAFAIADRDINVKVWYAISIKLFEPRLIDSQMPNPSPEFWDLTHKDSPDAAQPNPWSNIEPFIHIIKLERIQSRVHRTVFRVDKDVVSGPPSERAKLDAKMADMRSDLDDWLDTIPHPPKDHAKKITWMYDPESANHDAQDFFSLYYHLYSFTNVSLTKKNRQYHKAVLALFTVLLPTLDPSDHRFITSARSAASVCIAYKRLNQQKTLSYTMISLHSCFVAGLTLVYCLWRNRSLFGYDVLEATQACSQSLTIFGEKWSGAVKYRDIFDALSASLFKRLVNPSPSSGGLGFERSSVASKSRTNPPAAEAAETHDYRPREPTMSEMVSDAVKDAFMEVDEEAPGGWQGWRMWNDMLGDGQEDDAMESSEWDFGGVPQHQDVMNK